jgi:hypothetical protein
MVVNEPHSDTFSIIVITSLVSIGLLSGFIQLSLTLLLFVKHGAVFQNPDDSLEFVFLSDALRENTVLANAWMFSFIPSFTILVCVLTSYFWLYRRFVELLFVYITSVAAQTGLIFIVFFDNIDHDELHLVGVTALMAGFTLMHVQVIHFDWGLLQLTWHPSKIVDIVMLMIALVSSVIFVWNVFLPWEKTANDVFISTRNLCVLAEWVLLGALVFFQLNLPARAVRIAMHIARASSTHETKGI